MSKSYMMMLVICAVAMVGDLIFGIYPEDQAPATQVTLATSSDIAH